MSYLYRTGNSRNNIAFTNTANSSTRYLRRTSTGRNNIVWTTIPQGSTYNILQRNGTGRNNILWSNLNIPKPGVALSTKSSGSIIKIKENGTAKEYLVLKHNYPVSGRTLLLRKYILIEGQMAGRKNEYASVSPYETRITADDYFNNEFLNTIDSGVRGKIANVNIQYTPGGGGNPGVSTLSRKIFLLSYTELTGNTTRNADGQYISYFSSNSLRKAYYEGESSADFWWTRSAYSSNDSQAAYIQPDGRGVLAGEYDGTNRLGLRPAFTLPGDALINETTSEIVV